MNIKKYSAASGYENVNGIEVVDDISPYDLDCFNLIWDEGVTNKKSNEEISG